MNFIKKVFLGEIDESVHRQFKKFSRGRFENKALVIIKKSGNKASIKTSAEFSNELVKYCAGKLASGQKAIVTGIVLSTKDLREEFKKLGVVYEEFKQAIGLKKIIFNNELSREEIVKICQDFPDSFIGLSFSAGDTELKIKPKAPKSPKPSTKGGGKVKADFCQVKTSDSELIKSFAFDLGNFKTAEISHIFEINELIYPPNEKEPEKIREMAKRKGKIIRKLKVDGRDIVKEKEFEA